MTEPILTLAETLALTPADESGDRLIAPTSPRIHPIVYGGQLLGQAVMAAEMTTGEDRGIHSLHAYFVRGGSMKVPIEYEVERVQDGFSFSRRRIVARQAGEIILMAMASFQIEEEGPDHQLDVDSFPDPEELTPREIEWVDGQQVVHGVEAAFEIRDIPEVDRKGRGQAAVWLRALDPAPDDPAFHRSALAFASDQFLPGSATLHHGLTHDTPGLMVTSLDHGIWWHQPARVDDWLLFVSESPRTSSARGFSTGRVFRRDGVQVATTSQESMLRVKPSPSWGSETPPPLIMPGEEPSA